jgi:signal transduction histidine kinase/CheY-like chemotaxis protein
MGLHGRILAIALLPMLLASIILAAYFSHRSLKTIEAGLHLQGRNLSHHLAAAASLDLYSGQPLYLKRLIDHERAIHGADCIGIADMSGKWWLVNGQATLLQASQPGMNETEWWVGERLYFRHPIEISRSLYDVQPTKANGADDMVVIGHVTVVLPGSRIDSSRAEIIVATVILLSLLVLAAGMLAWRMSTHLSGPMGEIVEAVRAIAAGDLHTRVRQRSKGEIGELERGVNAMAMTLETNTRDLEKRIKVATASLLEQKRVADATTQTKSRFLAAASHDLRQPLHTLMLLVGALRERIAGSDPEALQLANHIETSTQSMAALLNTLLDLSRLDAGIVVASPTCCRVDELLQSLEQQFTPLAAEKGLRLRVRKSRMTIFSDPVLLERILANLVANAIRYTEHGGVLVGMRRVQQDWVRFEVWDSGIGIPMEYQSRIFEEYFRLDKPGRSEGKGLGLGLSIVLRLARLLGSDVGVRSTPGAGSCFSVRATRCELPAGHVQAAQESEPPPSSRPIVALIDDDTSVLEALLALFEHWQIEAATGSDAPSVIQDLLQLGRKPDAIISDYRLTEARTGIDAIADLRAAFGADLPAILITGETAASSLEAIRAAGLTVLHKPLKPARLRALLSHLLSRRPRPPS